MTAATLQIAVSADSVRETIIEVDFGPDDVLVLHVPGRITNETSERFRRQLLDVVARERVMVLSEGITYSVLRRKK